MSALALLTYKVAADAREFELIHRLNYQTFVEEIPQHAANPSGSLVDRFHDENTYVVCMNGDELVGMIALRGKRPFSLDAKLDDLDAYLPQDCVPCEARLLSVIPSFRKSGVFLGLLLRCVEIAKQRGYDLIVISGTTRQLKFYGHLGFRPFGPLVGTSEALFQPMSLDWEAFRNRVGGLIERGMRPGEGGNFLPGPVGMAEAVYQAFARPPISHRSAEFRADLNFVKSRLCALTNASDAAILLGSGTLANDVIAAQIALKGTPGLVLSNGEFGERLIDHARRFGLCHRTHSVAWGKAFRLADVEQALRRSPRPAWLWAVHCETSTGVLNDLPALKRLCRLFGVDLYMDCVSSIGAVEVDLTGVRLASCVSGKAIGSLPGISVILVNGAVAAGRDRSPRYLDLDLYLRGVPFTTSSNLVAALAAALTTSEPQRQQQIAQASCRLRGRLNDAGVAILADDAVAAPHVLTIPLPAGIDSLRLAEDLAERGILVAHASSYLVERNWIQVCLMGRFTIAAIDRLAAELCRTLRCVRAA